MDASSSGGKTLSPTGTVGSICIHFLSVRLRGWRLYTVLRGVDPGDFCYCPPVNRVVQERSNLLLRS